MCPSDELLIVDDDGPPKRGGAWKVLIVDDDADVHAVTRLALQEFEFAERGLSFVSAYSAREAREAVRAHPDAAVLFLDVVMETEQAGLELVHFVRRDASNDQIRIVLRTGQPGQAPEHRVVRDYDINDYREKTELTAQKLNTLMYATLRSFRDIVQLKEQGEELRRAERRAEAASRAKSAFLANLSHEFRTPLNGIIGLAQMMADETFGPLGHPKYREYCWDIKVSGEHLLGKIENVLELADQTQSDEPLDEEDFDLVQLVNDCLQSLRDGAALEFGGNGAGPPGPLTLHADRRAVRQMLMNLLSNALKYNPGKGDVNVAARIEADGSLTVSVLDNGPGIPADILREIGEPFAVEGEAYLWTRRGVGLGLALTKRLIERHDGHMEIDSVPDVGTTVRLVFPPARVVSRPRVP